MRNGNDPINACENERNKITRSIFINTKEFSHISSSAIIIAVFVFRHSLTLCLPVLMCLFVIGFMTIWNFGKNFDALAIIADTSQLTL
jgi:hypothetical protein